MRAYLDSVYEETPTAGIFSPHYNGPTRRVNTLAQALLVIVFGVACYFAISRYVVASVEVVGTSMVPTLRDQDYYLLNRWVYFFRDPKRYEVVVLRDPSDNNFSVKRVIAGSGETVCFRDGVVYVNGRKLTEPYLGRKTITYPANRYEQTIRCGKGEYVVLGDNRENSLDSRAYGTVSKQDILGMLIY